MEMVEKKSRYSFYKEKGGGRYSLEYQIQTTLTSALYVNKLQYQWSIKSILLDITFTITKLERNHSKLEHDDQKAMQSSNNKF